MTLIYKCSYAVAHFVFRLVPRPHYSARPKRFGSRGPIENVFPDRSPRIRHRNENAVQELGNISTSSQSPRRVDFLV